MTSNFTFIKGSLEDYMIGGNAKFIANYWIEELRSSPKKGSIP
eukprot:CAMPEP_0184674176 /NCGR_PEP_ID=MMETSP0308-20130426/87082_1 /TAXON_ID=38269 /ORGANISM="Gloeochaete witrockiana, Strain SAG 46.84" /LENGTH=42 /DNA_ID= /DNA_START= /DNA_END= /DNA_ORIENTATION=